MLSEKPEYAAIRHGDVILSLQWRHETTCSQRAADARLFFFYLSLVLVRVCKIYRIHHWCSVGTENPNPRVHRSSGKRGLLSFPLDGGPEGLGFMEPLNSNNRFFFSYTNKSIFSDVLYNICWWRHWGWCLQSMTRAVQINLKQRINSTLNNEKMHIWLFHQNGLTRTSLSTTVTWVSRPSFVEENVTFFHTV